VQVFVDQSSFLYTINTLKIDNLAVLSIRYIAKQALIKRLYF
jgi:hypothetical protein